MYNYKVQTKGKGVVDKGRNIARKIVCPAATRPLFPGENHALCMNYIGPGTNIQARLARGDKPVNIADKFAMEHDLDYYKIGELKRMGNTDKETLDRLVREADERFINGIKNSSDKGLFNKLTGYVSRQLIAGKNKLEDIGVMDKQKFIGNGLKPRKRKVKKRKLK